MVESYTCVLDNPIWHSLHTRHSHLAIGSSAAKRYPAEVTPFVAIESETGAAASDLLAIVAPNERIGILSVQPPSLDGWSVLREIDIYQYIWEPPARDLQCSPEAVRLREEHIDRML